MSYQMDELLRTLRNYDSAKTAHDEAMAECQGTWDWYGRGFIVALEKAENEFSAALLAVIDERVTNILAEKGIINP